MHNHISVYPAMLQGFSFQTIIIPFVKYFRGELYLCLDNNTCSNSRWWVYANDAKMNHEMFASIFNSLSELIFWQVVKWFQREKGWKVWRKSVLKDFSNKSNRFCDQKTNLIDFKWQIQGQGLFYYLNYRVENHCHYHI